jgi:hypothetical protein
MKITFPDNMPLETLVARLRKAGFALDAKYPYRAVDLDPASVQPFTCDACGTPNPAVLVRQSALCAACYKKIREDN